MSDSRPKGSLFSRLALKILAILVLCGILPSVAASVFLWRRNAQTVRDQVGAALETHLIRRAGEIEAWQSERLQDASRWSHSFVVLEGLEALSRSERGAGQVRAELKDYLESVLGNYRIYESLFIVDRRGEILAATRRERLEQWGRDLLAGTPGLDRGVVSPIHRSEVLGRPTLLVLYPIQGRGGQTLGHFVERIDLREFVTLFRPAEGDLSISLSFWLLDAAGCVLVREGRLAAGEQPLDPGSPLNVVRAGDACPASLPGAEALLLRLGPLSPPLGGSLVASVRRAEALRSLDESRARLRNFAVPVNLALLLLFVWVIRGLLGPIHLLSQGARRVSAGDLNIYLPVRGRDEIAGLTAAFNEMTRRLREGRQEIEEARDELARANQDLRSANRTLETLAITDGLTGLYNHRHFQDTLGKEMRRCEREKRPLSLLMIDIDHFKRFNDRWGHTEGDGALQRVAGQIMKGVRATDTAFRYGGEEIAVLLPGCMKEQARDVAEKIRRVVSASPTSRASSEARLTVSIGVSTFPDDGRVARGLVDAADAALYAAKARGRNQVVLAGPDARVRPLGAN